jgi:hypothetical protein
MKKKKLNAEKLHNFVFKLPPFLLRKRSCQIIFFGICCFLKKSPEVLRIFVFRFVAFLGTQFRCVAEGAVFFHNSKNSSV